MNASPERAFLEQLESRLSAGEDVEVEVSLALLGGQEVELDEDELRGARRRAMQLLATGGDPRREPDPDGRAGRALADDLDSPGRRSALLEGLVRLQTTVQGLPQVTQRLEGLVADEDAAWRWFACTLLAEELIES